MSLALSLFKDKDIKRNLVNAKLEVDSIMASVVGADAELDDAEGKIALLKDLRTYKDVRS